MNPIKLGNPNLFVKGMVEARVIDPGTGNIIGYDNVSTEAAVTSSMTMGEITGGFGNPLLINIPDTTRITGTLTSQAFSLKQRSLIAGGNLEYNAIVPVCETIKATGTTLTVSKQPEKAQGQSAEDTYAWCYVREHGKTEFIGFNWQVDLSTKQVVQFNAVADTSYDVFYFSKSASAMQLSLPNSFNPSVATIMLKYGVYAKQNNSVSNGTLQGYLYFIVPRAQFSGDVGISANQTSNSTTNYDWTAITSDEGIMDCDDCDNITSYQAYYIYSPCDPDSAVDSVVVIGSTSVEAGEDLELAVYLLMDDEQSIVTPDYSKLSFVVADTTIATTTGNPGEIRGVSAGSTNVTITYTKANGDEIKTVESITVTA